MSVPRHSSLLKCIGYLYKYKKGLRKIYYIPYYVNMPMCNCGTGFVHGTISNEWTQDYDAPSLFPISKHISLKDYGAQPFVVNINEAVKQNNTFRTALWTGPHLQVTLMSIRVGDDIGVEIHPDNDQFLRIEQGQGIVRWGTHKNNLNVERKIMDDSAIMIPAGTWHNIINTGNIPLKLYSIYAPAHHPFGTVHVTKEEAIAAEEDGF